MSKTRKRLRKAAMLGIGLLGASKLMGMKADLASKALKGDQYAKAKKAFTANRAYSGAKPLLKDKGIAKAAVTTLKRSDLPKKRNMKSIFVQDDGSIIQGLKKYKDKKAFASRNKPKYEGTFLQRYVLGPKFGGIDKKQRFAKTSTAEMGSFKGGKMIKAKQGYNARLDESLGMRNKKKSQSLKARRDESKGMEKAMGKGAYSGASTMAKKGKMIKARGGVMVKTKLNGNLYTETF